MSLPTKSELYGYHNKGNIYGNSTNNNDCIVLNIYKNENSTTHEDSSTNFNETEANLKLDYIYNNQITKKSVMQRPNNFVIYDNTRDNPYPLSENYRNQISSNEKPLKNIFTDNKNNKNINVNQIMNNYNIQQNTQNETNIISAPTPVPITISDDISSPKIYKKGSDLDKKKMKCWKITKIILIIILIIPLFICLLYFSFNGSNNGSDTYHHNGNLFNLCYVFVKFGMMMITIVVKKVEKIK